ncbi:SMI1/KNR4 family protein [Catenuloplanes sp. NPDC051500]|uniref:SMI1/KNR4 family protein n=1 Tax=Catenuloplanes sp. NPDC051500 TaxID=3363959 RepID=UPI0037980619
MGSRWPQSGTWIVVPTSATADWHLVTTVLAAAATARVAVAGVGIGTPPGKRLLTHVATWADLHDGAKDPLRLADALRIIDALAHGHDLVLVVNAGGLLVPAGRTGWTMADLAAALGAPTVVVVGDDPRGVNYTTVEALEARGLASALVTVGDAPKSLPADPAGRIPAGVREVDPETARGFLDPALHAVPDAIGPRPARRSPRAPAGSGWPDNGPWVVAPASADADWESAVTVLAAASTARVAAVAFGVPGAPGVRPAAHLGSWVVLRDGAKDPVRPADAVAVTEALARTHELVLVIGTAGPLAPTGWTLLDLADALSAPVIVVTTGDPGEPGHVSRMIGAIEGRGLAAAIITAGDAPPGDATPEDATPGHATPGHATPGHAAPGQAAPGDAAPGHATPRHATPGHATTGDAAPGDDLSPVRPTGRIPADPGALDADSARALLDPRLHARPAPVPLPTPAQARMRTPSTRAGGVRAAILVLVIFVVMAVGAVGLAYLNRTTPDPEPPAGVGMPAAPQPHAERDDGYEDLCREFRLGGEPTRPGAEVSARVDAAWLRIESWLAARAPATHRALLPPAAGPDIDAAQRRMSVAFPPDLVASLLRHDGAESFAAVLPAGYRPMPVAEIVDNRAALCEVVSETPELSGTGWVPFADDVTGGFLLVDQRPGGHGRVGEFGKNGLDFEAWPVSVADLLEQTATSLETGRPLVGDVRPVVEDGFLSWF